MGLFDELRSVFGGDAGGDGGASGDESPVEDERPTAPPASDEAPLPDDAGDLVAALAAAPSGARRTRLGFAVVERAGSDPASVAAHADALVDLLDEPASTSRVAAAALGHAAAADRDLAAEYEAALLGALDHEDAVTRGEAADALAALARERSVDSAALAAVLEREDVDGWHAARVLAVVAAERPESLPVNRLAALRDAEDEATRGCASYVLAVLAAATAAADGRTEPVGAATAADYVETVRAVSEADGTGFASSPLLDDAALRVVDDAVPDADCRGVEWAQTPMGTQLVVTAGDPDALADALLAEGADGPKHRLEAELGFEDLQMDVQGVD